MDEQLERIKKDLTYLANSQNKIVTLGISDYEYIIQQAEKSEELQAKVEELEKQYSTRLGKFLKIQEEKKRYKEAMEFYANPQIWKKGKLITDNRYEMPLAYNDNGEKARQELRGESND